MLGEQIILERANALPTPTLVIRVAAHQSSDNTVSSLHASMSGPWGSLQGDGVRQTPAPATTSFAVQYMSSQDENCYTVDVQAHLRSCPNCAVAMA